MINEKLIDLINKKKHTLTTFEIYVGGGIMISYKGRCLFYIEEDFLICDRFFDNLAESNPNRGFIIIAVMCIELSEFCRNYFKQKTYDRLITKLIGERIINWVNDLIIYYDLGIIIHKS